MSLKKLVIAEKPSVGRDIARVLGAGSKCDGYLENDEYIVSWAVGHLVSLFEPEDYDSAYKRWQLSSLPIIPDEIKLKGIEAAKKQLEVLNTLMNSKNVSEIICATDAGREGELIFRYIYSYTGCSKPFKRLWISSMTDEAVITGFAGLKPGSDYDALYHSARCRSHADWLVGINATRAYTIRYDTLLSIGRVQTPTLALITKRQEEIDAFVPKDYFVLRAWFKHKDDEYTALWMNKDEETAVNTQAEADTLCERLKDKTGVILSVEHEDKKELPYLLYDLTTLQRDANAKYGFSAQRTLDIAQDLYEKRKYITYPRTDSKYLTSDMEPKLRGVTEKLEIDPYTEYAWHLLALPKLPVNKRIIDDAKVSDHHAIIPTSVNFNLDKLSVDEKRIFDLIARRFLQAFYPPYLYKSTKVITQADNELFISRGTTVKDLGFLELYKSFNKQEKEESAEAKLPPSLVKGLDVTLTDIKAEPKRTKPPKAYTEASLLFAMEHAGRFVEDEALREQMRECGLGTPATRASIIERLISVGYIERKGKTLAPTVKGVLLIKVVPPELKSPETTGKWERGLTQIARQKMEPQKFIDSIKRYVYYLVEQSQKAPANIKFPQENKPRRK